MSEMIERVAWAIGAISDTPWAMTAARAAIEAMREPTEAMKGAGCVGCAGLEEIDPSMASLIWDAMIDAALGKKP